MYVDPFFLELVSFLTEKSFLLLSGLGKESFPVLWEANMKKKKKNWGLHFSMDLSLHPHFHVIPTLH
jgi:hypothetical protein